MFYDVLCMAKMLQNRLVINIKFNGNILAIPAVDLLLLTQQEIKLYLAAHACDAWYMS